MSILRRRRMTEHQEIDTEGSWAISYGDMITLLLTFFILFFSTDPERDRLKSMNSALLAALGSQSKMEPQPISSVSELDDVMAKKLAATVHHVGQKLIVEFPEVSFFEFGQVELTNSGNAELSRFLQLYLPYAGNYILGIRAYTDNKPVMKSSRRRFNDNLELSALRAIATMRSLQGKGLPLDRMRLGAYGELRITAGDLKRAIASNPEYATKGLALARKVVLVIEPDVKENL